MLLVFPAFACYGYVRSGASGIAAAAVAGSVCWLGSLLALVLLGWLRGGPWFLHAWLLGMVFRFGLPLGAGIALTRGGGPLAEADVFGMMVVYYLVGLLCETLLSVRLLRASTGGVAGTS
jgi:hypothetical protein